MFSGVGVLVTTMNGLVTTSGGLGGSLTQTGFQALAVAGLIGRGLEPSALMSQSRLRPSLSSTKTRARPSGDQEGWRLLPGRSAVRGRTVPEGKSTSMMMSRPSWRAVKAIVRPSGDQAGAYSRAGEDTSCQAQLLFKL